MNRRQNLRKSRRLQVRFWTEDDPHQRAGFTTNISATGMFVGTRNPLSVGAELTVRTLTEPAFEVQARVARTVKVPPALQMVKQPGMGLHFLEKNVGERLAEDVAASRIIPDTGAPPEEVPVEPQPASVADEPGPAASPPAPIDRGPEPPAAAPSTAVHNPAVDATTRRPATVPNPGSGSNQWHEERRMLQSRVVQLEEKVGALYADNQSLRRYSDLLESTRKRLTAEIAAARVEQDARAQKDPEDSAPTASPTGADSDDEATMAQPGMSPEEQRALEEAAAEASELRRKLDEADEERGSLAARIDELSAALDEAQAVDPTDSRAENESLRARNADLASQLEDALREDVAPPAASESSLLGGPAVWGSLAGVALLGFLLGFLLRPADGEIAAPDGPAVAQQTAPAPETPTETRPPEAPAIETESTEPTSADATEDLPPQPVAPDLATVDAAIRQWAAAWAAQDADTYLDAYSIDFVPPLGYDWDSWAAVRRERVSAPSSIEVELADLRVEGTGLGRATARFLQSYATPTYQDRVQKTLELGWEEGQWRILGEYSEPVG